MTELQEGNPLIELFPSVEAAQESARLADRLRKAVASMLQRIFLVSLSGAANNNVIFVIHMHVHNIHRVTYTHTNKLYTRTIESSLKTYTHNKSRSHDHTENE